MLRAKDWETPPFLMVPSWEWVEVEVDGCLTCEVATDELENSPPNQGNRRSGAVGQWRRVGAQIGTNWGDSISGLADG